MMKITMIVGVYLEAYNALYMVHCNLIITLLFIAQILL